MKSHFACPRRLRSFSFFEFALLFYGLRTFFTILGIVMGFYPFWDAMCGDAHMETSWLLQYCCSIG
jgi:hypothetical protein